MRDMSRAPSVVPNDATVYLVLDDFNSSGRAYRETDPAEADEKTVLADLIAGQFENPLQIIAFNVDEGWARDVSEDIARKLFNKVQTGDRVLSAAARHLIARHASDLVSND
jgi:hypothetical protein